MAETKYRYVGLDIETTGSTFQPLVKTIQLGVATGMPVYAADLTWGEYEWEQGAQLVNGFTADRILKGRDPHDVDREVVAWLDHLYGDDTRLHAVGWNVASFDLRFVDRDLPLLGNRLHYRTVDLNAICFLLDGIGGWGFDQWKDRAKRHAAKLIGTNNWHDAGFDAQAALFAFYYLQERVIAWVRR